MRPDLPPLRSRALALALCALSAAGDSPPLHMKFCTDGSCNSGCTQWDVAASGACAPGTAGNSWISSTSTFSTVESGDKLVWQWFQDSAASHVCDPANLIPTCNATIRIDGSCHAVTICGGLIKGSMQVNSTAPAWVIAIAVIFPLLGLCCLCYCAYRCCCAPGTCCGRPKAPHEGQPQTQFELMQAQQAQAAQQYPAYGGGGAPSMMQPQMQQGGGYPQQGGGYPQQQGGGYPQQGGYPQPQAFGSAPPMQQAMPMGYSVQGSINGGGGGAYGSSVAPSAFGGGYPQAPQAYAQSYALPQGAYALPQTQATPMGYGGRV